MSDIQPLSISLKPFLSLLTCDISAKTLIKLVLSKYQGDEPLKQIQIRPVELKGQWQLSFTYKYQTNDVTRNFLPEAAIVELTSLIGHQFFAANLFSKSTEAQVNISKKGKVLFLQKALTQSVNTSVTAEHNRDKHRFLTLDRPFLKALGVTDASAELIPAMSRKWKQINKFIEIFSGAVQETGLSEQKQLHVADFGSGKAYLTFAMHDYVTNTLGLDAKVTGVELRQNLVDLCNKTAKDLNLHGLQFEQGDVKHFKARGINVMIALHACDIATDYAIHMGIETGADIIMCSPCCHKQIRPQMSMPTVLAPMLTHGIHLGQEAEMLTDSLRALLLEANGYSTKVFEFISLEHTSKNKMILATKSKHKHNKDAILKQIDELKRFYGVKQHYLEGLLEKSALEKGAL